MIWRSIGERAKATLIKKMGKRGQIGPANLIALFVLIIILGVMMPVVYPFIELGANATNDTVTKALIYLLPPGIVIGVFLVIFRYEQPYYQQPPM